MSSSEKKLAAQNARELAGSRGGETAPPSTPLPKMLRFPDVIEATGNSRTTIWRGIRAGTFPAPVQLGPNSVGWPEPVIAEWLASRPTVHYAGDTGAPEAA